MPVLVNRESGLAENLSPEQQQAALQADTHDVPLNDPQGNPVTASYGEASNLLQQGYTQPKSEQLQNLLDYSKFSSPAEQAKTAAEGVASSLTFGASSAAERALGVPSEDINARREINPVTHALGEAAGLGAGMLTGTGEAALLEKAGAAVGKQALARMGSSAAGRIGSAAAKVAAENALYATGDEASKLFASDPNQSIETAASNIGLSGLLGLGAGGALKGTGELWAMGPGKKLQDMMTAIANKSQGLPSELKLASGVDLAPEMEAALSENPAARQAFQTLQESTTKSGLQAQESLGKFNDDVRAASASVLNKTPEDIEALGSMSKAEAGKAFQDKLSSALDSRIKPISEQYDKFQEQFKDAAFGPAQRVKLENDVSQMIANEGLSKGANEAGLGLAQKALEQIKLQDNAQDLRKYIQSLYQSAPFGSEKYQVGKSLRSLFSDALDSTIGEHAASKGPEVLDSFKQTQAEYGQFKDVLSSLNDRLHLGKDSKGSPAAFLDALKSADPESIVSRMSLKGDTNLQQLLDKQFPEVAQLAREQEINNLAKASLDKSGEAVDPKKLFNNFNKLEPELRNYMLPQKSIEQLQALEQLVNQVPSKMNPSGTAKTLDALWNKIPESAGALVSLLTGHNPIAGYVIGKAGNWLGREAPDAVRLAMLKFLGSEGRVSATGLKAAAQTAGAVIKGERALSDAAKNVFGIGAKVIKMPDAAQIDKLRGMVDKVAENPQDMLDDDSKIGHYLPDHSMAVGVTNGRAISYLASLRPSTAPMGPLDPERQPSPIEEADYKAALLVAEQPLSVLKSIKDGALTPKDMQHLQAMYPALYQRMQDKLTESMLETHGKGSIPYKTKLSLSMFMARPLESSMRPASIMASQNMAANAAQAAPRPIKNVNKLDKLSATYATPSQSREAHRVMGK